MKKILRSLILITMSLLLFSCATEDKFVPENIDKTKTGTTELWLSQLDTTMTVDKAKAIHVAQLFNQKHELTRSVPLERTIKEVETVTDKTGRPYLYIINYTNNQGFTIVSASQDYNPVLAFSDIGNFNLSDINNTGASIWLDNQKEIIKSIEHLPDSIKQHYRKLWTEYNITRQKILPTRSDNDVYNLVSNYIHQWEAEGYNVFRYSDVNNTTFFNELPSDLIISIRQAVDSAHPDYGGRANNTFILVKRDDNYQSVGPLVQTHWSQKNGYNQCIPNKYPVGCVAVAMGQIMKYHEYPQYYAWDQMANNYATSATAEFLYEIGQQVNMEYDANGSSSNINNALSAFKNYFGYTSAQKISHSYMKVLSELKENNPVYMRGVDSSDGGHAWVCDGYYSITVMDEYVVYILEDTYGEGEPLGMTYIDSDLGPILASNLAFHMNWGWNSHDGYFTDDDINIDGLGYNFSKHREDIISLYPTN